MLVKSSYRSDDLGDGSELAGAGDREMLTVELA